MQRSLSSLTLLFASVSAILGSGWLFNAYYAANLTGVSALLSWVVGGGMIAVLAFTFAELSAAIPITGSSSRIPHYTHGSVVSFIFAWIIWLSYVSLAPTEVQALIQYSAYFYPNLMADKVGSLSSSGYLLAFFLMLIASAINAFSIRWLFRANTGLTVVKICIPVLISLFILYQVFFHPASSSVSLVQAPFFSHGLLGFLSSLSVGGIVFSFNGFKQACDMAGEARNPKFALPFAIIGALLICLLLYLLLQVSFLFALKADNISRDWSVLYIRNHTSPFSSLLEHFAHGSVLIALMCVGAVLAPFAAALMYINGGARSLYAMSKNDYLPAFFQKMNPQGNPSNAIFINFLLGMLFFFPLPGWNKMVTFLTSLMAITYVISPICLLALRAQAPDLHRPFKLPMVKLWTWCAFFICTLLTYWSGWATLSKLGFCLAAGLVVLLCYSFFAKKTIALHWKSSLWLWIYFGGMLCFSYLGCFGNGLGLLSIGWDFCVLAVFCAVVLWLSQKYKLPACETLRYLHKISLPKC